MNVEVEGDPGREGEALPVTERTGDLTEEPAAAESPGAEVVSPQAPSSRRTFLIAVGAAALVAFFAVVFFMAGFAAHAMLDDDEGGSGGSGGSAASASLADDPSWGPEDAKVTIEAFSDFQCPYCKKFAEETLPQLKEDFGDRVRYIARDLPLASIHPVATAAAEAAGCANNQGVYWEYHDLLYQNQASLSEAALVEYAIDAGADESQFSDCLTEREQMAEVLLDVQDAQRQGVSSTPSFLINGLLLSGAQPYSLFRALIEQQLGAE